MKTCPYTRVSIAVALVAVLVVGMLRDPDVAIADELGQQPGAPHRMPGYQVIPNVPAYEPLTKDELAKLNAPVDGPAPTF